MDKQKKKQKGITLIALVISIIVMLILAGVSLNMTVGDNGIISQAQQATFMQSMAVLEEFLNQKYIDDELKDVTEWNNDGTEMSPLEKIARRHQEWFYSHGSDDYVLVEYNYTEAGETKTDYLMLHLINKEGLARTQSTLVDSIKGGEANGNDENAYLNLIDVYGVTDDLKVYYCENGLATSIGANYANSKTFDSTSVLYQSTSGLAKAIAETTGGTASDLSLQDLRSTTELIITPNSGLKDLSVLYDLQSLTKLTLKNYTGSLEGIGSASKLKYIYFENRDGSQKIDYTGIEKAKRITELYMYMPTDREVENLITAMSQTDYSSLTTIGFYGHMNDDTSSISKVQSSSNRSTFSNANLLNGLSSNTKSAIVKMYLQNNSIGTGINLIGFTRLQGLRLNCNNITNITSLPTSITSLAINNNLITATDLTTINGITSLGYLCLSNNPNLTSIKNIANRTVSGHNYCIYELVDTDYPIFESTDTEFVASLKKIPKLTLSTKYDLILSNKDQITINTSQTESQVSVLSGNTAVTMLNISGCTQLSNGFLQTLLGSLPNLKWLKADSTNLASLGFLRSATNSTGPQLSGIDIRNTPITDISALNTTYQTLSDLRCSQYFDMSQYQRLTANLLNNDHASSRNDVYGSSGGLYTTNINTLKSLKDCTFLTGLNFYSCPGFTDSYEIDLTGLSITNVYLHGYSNVKFILPSTVTYIRRVESCIVDATRCTGLTYVYFSQGDNNCTWPTTLNLCQFHFYSQSIGKVFIPSSIKQLDLQYSNPWCTFRDIHTGFRPTTGTVAETVDIACIQASNLETFFINSKIQNIKMYLCNAQKLPKTKDDTVTTSINIGYNKIVSLEGLENFTNLTSLNLEGNTTLFSNFSIKKADGTSSSYDTLQYIIDSCPRLTYLNLSGIENLTDFSKLTNAGFTDNGSHVFTRTL